MVSVGEGSCSSGHMTAARRRRTAETPAADGTRHAGSHSPTGGQHARHSSPSPEREATGSRMSRDG